MNNVAIADNINLQIYILPLDGFNTVLSYFFRSFSDVHIDGTIAHYEIVAPNLVKNFSRVKTLSGLGNKKAQQFKLLPRKFHLFTILNNNVFVFINGYIVMGDNLLSDAGIFSAGDWP